MSDKIKINPDWALLSGFSKIQPNLFKHPDLCSISESKYTKIQTLLQVNGLRDYINEFCFLINSVRLVELFTDSQKNGQKMQRKRNKDLEQLNEFFSDRQKLGQKTQEEKDKNLKRVKKFLADKWTYYGVEKVKIQFTSTAKKSLVLENLLNDVIENWLYIKEKEFKADNGISFEKTNHAPIEPYKDTLKYIPEIDNFLMRTIKKKLSQNVRIDIIKRVFDLANFDFSKVRTSKSPESYIRNILNTTSKNTKFTPLKIAYLL